MFKLTTAVKAWIVDNAGCKQDASDEDFRKAGLKSLLEGNLTDTKYAELTVDEDEKAAAAIETKLDQTLAALEKFQKADEHRAQASEKPAGTKGNPSPIEKAFAAAGGSEQGNSDPHAGTRVKGAWEQYSDAKGDRFYPTKTLRDGPHPLAGRPVRDGDQENGRAIQSPSQRDKACVGAYLKFCVQGTKNLPPQFQMTDHDRDLFNYAIRNMEWAGVLKSGGTGDDKAPNSIALTGRKLRGEGHPINEQKALIDDSTSGGLEAAPIVFDDMVITTPLLYGEFFPSVTVVPITRGRRVEGVSVSNITLQSGGADNTNMTLFTTTAFVTAFDTTIFGCDGAIEMGLDFLSDSPVDFTSLITEQYGRRLLQWLDEQITIGDGTTEPEGITVASGTVSVAGGSAAPTVGVYESFFFGVAKKYKQGYPSDRIMFGANETTYQRARAIAVGASDARRIFGMTHGDYMLMGHKYGINEGIANTKAFFANMARYRMYRRLGMTIKATTEGQTLVRKNLMMISCRSRWGGHLELAAAAAVSTTMQA